MRTGPIYQTLKNGTRIFTCSSLTGGTAGKLDNLWKGYDLPANFDLATGDIATVGLDTFIYDAASAAAEVYPDIIKPDGNAGNGRWLRTVYVHRVIDHIAEAEKAAILAGTTTYNATADILSCLSRVSAYSTVDFGRGVYLIGDTYGIVINGKANINFIGSAMLKAANTNQILNIQQATALTFSGLTFDGNQANMGELVWDDLVYVGDSAKVVFDNSCRFQNAKAGMTWRGTSATGPGLYDSGVRNCVFANVGAYYLTSKFIEQKTFTGTGANDATIEADWSPWWTYFDFEVEIEAGATTFKWRKSEAGGAFGAWVTGIAIGTSFTYLNPSTGYGGQPGNLVKIKWGATSGHVAGDKWTFRWNEHRVTPCQFKPYPANISERPYNKRNFLKDNKFLACGGDSWAAQLQEDFVCCGNESLDSGTTGGFVNSSKNTLCLGNLVRGARETGMEFGDNDGILITANRFIECDRPGLNLFGDTEIAGCSARNYNIVGNIVIDCNTQANYNNGQPGGISIFTNNSTTLSGLKISDNIIADNRGGSAKMSYGIHYTQTSGGLSGVQINGNNITGQVTDDVSANLKKYLGAGVLSQPQEFTSANLSAGILTITHGLNKQFVHVTVWNDSNKEVTPDEITATSSTVVTIDLSSFTVNNTWRVRVS